MKRRLGKYVLAVVVSAGLAGGTAFAAGDPVKERIDLMKGMGDAIGKLAAILKGEAEFNGANVAAAGETISGNLKKASKLFPNGSAGGKSRAKPEVWSDNATFMKGFDIGEAAAQNVIKVGKEDDEIGFQEVMGGLGKSCKGCHEKFRKPKEEGR